MKILGLNHDMWISSAALIIDGKIVAACPEERLTRLNQSVIQQSVKEIISGIDQYLLYYSPYLFIL